MGSQIDATKPADGIPASKAVLRASLAAAKSEIEHGGFFTAAYLGAAERTSVGKLREIALSVTDFEAVGDGTTDDTLAFANALAAINDSGRPGTLFVPAPPGGSYRIRSINLEPKVAIRVVGERSRLRRLDNVTQLPGYDFSAGRLFNIFGITSNPIDALGYYGRVTFEGIIFDGNRENQAQPGGEPWNRAYGLEWFHAVAVEADEAQPWRQPVSFFDCDFEYTNGEGISIFRNAAVHIERCRFYACFRGAFHVVGHWVEVSARDCLSDDPWDTDTSAPNSGIGTEFEAEGYRRANKIHIDGWEFRQGFVNVVTQGDERQKSGQTVAPLLPEERNEFILRRITVAQSNRAEQVKFYSSGEAIFKISDSTFYGGRQDTAGDPNRRTCVDGRNIEVDSCTFIASNNGLPTTTSAPAEFIALSVRDLRDYTGGSYGHRFTNCRFMFDETCLNAAGDALAAPVYAISNGTNTLYQSQNLPFSGGFPPPNVVLDSCKFGYLKYYSSRDDTQLPNLFLFDYLFRPNYGGSWRFANCHGFGRIGFRLTQNSPGLPGFYEFIGGNYVVEEAMFQAYSIGSPTELLQIRFSDFWQEDRYNHIAHDSGWPPDWDNIVAWAGRQIMVVSDPTAAAPVQISDRLMFDVVRPDNLYQVRLEGTPVVPSTLTIENVQQVNVIQDDGAGSLVDASDGVTVVGSIDYASGWVRFSWPQMKLPEELDEIVHSYQHGNEVPGFKGDLAVLKSDPSSRWICSAASPTAATWTTF